MLFPVEAFEVLLPMRHFVLLGREERLQISGELLPLAGSCLLPWCHRGSMNLRLSLLNDQLSMEHLGGKSTFLLLNNQVELSPRVSVSMYSLCLQVYVWKGSQSILLHREAGIAHSCLSTSPLAQQETVGIQRLLCICIFRTAKPEELWCGFSFLLMGFFRMWWLSVLWKKREWCHEMHNTLAMKWWERNSPCLKEAHTIARQMTT